MGNLTNIFRRCVNAWSQSETGFAVEKLAFVWRREVLSELGIFPNWAIPKNKLIQKLEEILPKGHMTAMNAAAFMCAVSVRHKHSNYDPLAFFQNFLRLYNAKSFDEVCQVEKIKVGSQDYKHLKRVYDNTALYLVARYDELKQDKESSGDELVKLARLIETKKLEAIKIQCWASDIESATDGTLLGRAFGHHHRMSVDELKQIVYMHRSPKEDKIGLLEADGKKTLSAFPKDEYLPLLREQRKNNNISETQCGIILSFILHAQERRRDGSSYMTHPMGVADLVRQHGGKYLGNNEGLIWQAMVAALLHDGGEKSNIDLHKDLDGLLPDDVIEAIKCLHKKDDDTYFEYIERIADNPLAAVVKSCDLYHNSLDAGDKPSFKQLYTYPIAANYLEYRLNNPDSKVGIKDFAKQSGICLEMLRGVSHYTDYDKKVDVNLLSGTIGRPPKLRSFAEIFVEKSDLNIHAYPRREESPPVHP